MLRIRKLTGEEVASLPLAELSDVKMLKQRLHQQHGLPPCFRQRLLELADDIATLVLCKQPLTFWGINYLRTI